MECLRPFFPKGHVHPTLMTGGVPPAEWSTYWDRIIPSATLCVAVLIGSDFMPVSILTRMATSLGATEGATCQAIFIREIFAVIASLLVATAAGKLNRGQCSCSCLPSCWRRSCWSRSRQTSRC